MNHLHHSAEPQITNSCIAEKERFSYFQVWLGHLYFALQQPYQHWCPGTCLCKISDLVAHTQNKNISFLLWKLIKDINTMYYFSNLVNTYYNIILCGYSEFFILIFNTKYLKINSALGFRYFLSGSIYQIQPWRIRCSTPALLSSFWCPSSSLPNFRLFLVRCQSPVLNNPAEEKKKLQKQFNSNVICLQWKNIHAEMLIYQYMIDFLFLA